MMTRSRFTLATLCLTAVLACGSVTTAPYAPVEAKTEYTAEALYNAAVRTLVRMGYGFTSRDPGAFAIETEYTKVDTGWTPTSYRYSWRIFTAGGTLSIYASCILKERGEECPRGERPPRVIDEQERLRTGILSDAATFHDTGE